MGIRILVEVEHTDLEEVEDILINPEPPIIDHIHDEDQLSQCIQVALESGLDLDQGSLWWLERKNFVLLSDDSLDANQPLLYFLFECWVALAPCVQIVCVDLLQEYY